MAQGNTLYPQARQAFLTGDLNWGGASSDSFAVVLVDEDYAGPAGVSFATATDITTELSGHIIQDSTPANASVAISSANDGAGTATSSTSTTVFTNIPAQASGKQIGSLVVYRVSDNLPVVYLDDGINLPLTPNGGDITVYWNSTGTPGEIFKL